MPAGMDIGLLKFQSTLSVRRATMAWLETSSLTSYFNPRSP